ncbi:unnamed protein product [Didymodactylos carnosus]|uniref:Helicase C-terminal domain-containing protein n=1 Tax=Didymodactylos carnosus TaxID=1234261 RepID=A0A815WHQ5_9BILA|nr:unnamed protein product [Didymodactylos carnosus]CAF4403876.1 unnamed protein product [Didymodactylos carnosus]
MDKDTGIEQLTSHWSNGLHIFLQLKYCSFINDECLKAVFMSNMNFFKRYNNLRGMTGTIGDKEERELLTLEYDVDCFELPRFKKYRFKYEKMKEIVCSSEREWYEKLIEDVNEKMELKTNKMNNNNKEEINNNKIQLEERYKMLKLKIEKTTTQLNDEFQKKSSIDKRMKTFKEMKNTLLNRKIQNQEDYDDNDDYSHQNEICEININQVKNEFDDINETIIDLEESLNLYKIQESDLIKNIQNYELLLNTENSVDQRRAVLIICENIVKLEKISLQVRKEFQHKGNKIYTYDRAYRKFEKSQLNCGDIIIATNIAGRGTDLDIDKFLERNGGLHVILTYTPNNLRVEKQAFGRTARAGKRGTGIYIVYDERKSNNCIPNLTIDYLSDVRNENEKERVNQIVTKSFHKIKIEDELFGKFDVFKNELNKIIERKYLNLKENELKENYFELQIKSLQNKWAFWLNNMEEKLE